MIACSVWILKEVLKCNESRDIDRKKCADILNTPNEQARVLKIYIYQSHNFLFTRWSWPHFWGFLSLPTLHAYFLGSFWKLHKYTFRFSHSVEIESYGEKRGRKIGSVGKRIKCPPRKHIQVHWTLEIVANFRRRATLEQYYLIHPFLFKCPLWFRVLFSIVHISKRILLKICNIVLIW